MRKVTLTTLALALMGILLAANARTEQNLKGSEEIVLSNDGTIITWGAPTTNTVSDPNPDNNDVILDVPANDDCANATTIGDNESLYFTTIDATIDGPQDYITQPNVWFKYTASITGPVQVVVADTGLSTLFNVNRCVVYDGSACPEFIGNFPEPSAFPAGETIETARAITSLPAAVSGTTVGYNKDYEFEASCFRYNTGCGGYMSDGFYSYTAESDDFINVYLDIDPTVRQGYPFLLIVDEDANELGCDRMPFYFNINASTTTIRIDNFPVEAGETYYIVVGNHSGFTGDPFVLSVTSSGDYIMAGYMMEFLGVERMTIDVVQGQEYLIELAATDLYDYGQGYLTLIPNPHVPENDMAENATDAGVIHQPGDFVQVTGDNRGAPTIDFPWIDDYPDVWIKFTTEETMDISLGLCGTAESFHNLSLALYSGLPVNPCGYSDRIGTNLHAFNQRCTSTQVEVTWPNLAAGEYWYQVISHYSSEGEYIYTIKGCQEVVCADNALFGRVPPTDVITLGHDGISKLSSVGSQYAVADKFTGVDAPISQVTWWGDDVTEPLGFEVCDSDTLPFQIIFCNDHDGLPADTVAHYEVDASCEETGYYYHIMHQSVFHAYLPEPVEISEGWLIIRGYYDENVSDCDFRWQASDGDEGDGVQYDEDYSTWNPLDMSFGFCLEPIPTGIDDEPVDIPLTYELVQNYPNPFNATTSIQFSLKNTGNVNLSVYDVGGRLIKTLQDGVLSAGSHSVVWDGTNKAGETVSSGVYFYRLVSSEGSFAKQMVLLK